MIKSTKYIKPTLLIRMLPYHLQFLFYDFSILNIVKCECVISIPICLIEKILTLLICQQSFVHTLLEIKFVTCSNQFIKYLFPVFASEYIVIKQTNILSCRIIKFFNPAMNTCFLIILIHTKLTLSYTTSCSKTYAYIGVFL